MSALHDIEAMAARWLVRQEAAEWSEADAAELAAWLEQAAAHKAAYWRLEHGWRMADRLAALRTVAGPVRPALRLAPRPLAMAASVALAVLVAGGVTYSSLSFGRHAYVTLVGGRQSLTLPDGSKVELSTNTRLVAKVSANQRTVWLDKGEAYFEVAKDPRHPFSIYAGDRKVTVLGTKFSVRHEGDQVRVAVVEGRVRIDPIGAAANVRPEVVTRGDMVIAERQSTLLVAASDDKVADELSWRHGMLTFNRETLGDAVAEFNRYNRVKLSIGDPAAGQVRIGGAFRANEAEAFARLLGQAYGLKISRQDDEIIIGS